MAIYLLDKAVLFEQLGPVMLIYPFERNSGHTRRSKAAFKTTGFKTVLISHTWFNIYLPSPVHSVILTNVSLFDRFTHIFTCQVLSFLIVRVEWA